MWGSSSVLVYEVVRSCLYKRSEPALVAANATKQYMLHALLGLRVPNLETSVLATVQMLPGNGRV